jgi:hypothetical protein
MKRWRQRKREPVDKRVAALRRFAMSITVFTILGAFVLGFEDPWAQPVVALAVAYPLEVALEALDAWGARRRPKFAGGPRALFDFLLPAHITALSIALLLYPGERLGPLVLAVVIGIASKFIFRVRVNGRMRHFLNPSNLGISVVLVAFPSVGIIPPYHFTENAFGAVDWAIPLAIAVAGTMLNAKLTGKGPLILAFVVGFAVQALVRSALFDTPVLAPLLPLTGVAVILYTNYMITDPGTSPVARNGQIAFGLATAAVYGLLVSMHVVFGLFFALTIVCAARGLSLWALQAVPVRRMAGRLLPQPVGR